jgi:hypothetical protein
VTTAYHPWGRVDADGTVYVRTADGERVIGSWQAGSPEEAIAFFQRKYEALETEVVLLEQRIASTDIAPAQASASVNRLVQAINEANALGDLDGLRTRVERLVEDVGHRREEAKAAREQARVQAKEIKERIVAEAEQIAAEATHWKSSGERMRELLEEWKAAPHAERSAEAVLWKRLSAARNAFTKRRKAYFATLEAEREDVKARKEKLVADAEALSGSTDWGPTTSAYRELMGLWKAAGRADRDAEAELWKRFRAAQDKFFNARSEVFSAKDAELREHSEAKQQLLDQAQGLLPVSDIRSARSALRGIQERWEQIGAVPRDSREHLESGLRRVEDAIRKTEEAQWHRSNPEALARAEGTVAQLRSTIAQLEEQLTQARERGDAAAAQSAEEALTARRAWLTEAEHTLAEFKVLKAASAGDPASAGDAVDVVDAVDGADGAQHVPEVLGIPHLEREPADRHPIPAGRHGRGQDVDVLVRKHPGHVGQQPGPVERLHLDGHQEHRAVARRPVDLDHPLLLGTGQVHDIHAVHPVHGHAMTVGDKAGDLISRHRGAAPGQAHPCVRRAVDLDAWVSRGPGLGFLGRQRRLGQVLLGPGEATDRPDQLLDHRLGADPPFADRCV